MRQRITFIHKASDGVPFEDLTVSDAGIKGPEIKSVREDRVTLALEELPSELSQLLSESHELHIRWVSPEAYDTVSPLDSRVSPGFHLFYTPKKEGQWDASKLCEALSNAFGATGCSSSESFTSLPNDRFSHSAAFQYYEPLENLTQFIQHTADKLCPTSNDACKSRTEDLKRVSSLDVSYDTISHALKMTAQWPYDLHQISVASTPGHRTEVGILTTDTSSKPEPHEIGMTGGLTVLGEHKKPSPVLFNVPARHRRHAESAPGSSFSAKFLEPTGLHPTLQLTLSSPRPPVDDAYCAIHAHFTLPKAIFADRYQLSDDIFLKSKNLTALRYSSMPVDLEAPAYATKPWGSGVLLELAPPASAEEKDGEWTAEVPLHLRYLEPAAGGYTDLQLPYPAVFWACSSEEGTKFPSSPFERVNLGYDALFGPRTVFWHVEPQPAAEAEAVGASGAGGRLTSSVRVPVLEAGQAGWVRMGTAGAVMLGFAWVLWRLVAAYSRIGYGKNAAAAAKVGEKKTQ